MTLKELQSLIKEEFDALTFQEAEEDEMDNLDVNVDSDELEAEEGGDTEDVLRKIYDLLASHFEGGEEGVDDLEEPEDVEGEEEPEAELEELANHGVGKSASNSSGANAGYTPAKTTTGDKKLHESKVLQERFQKLANIIK